MTNQIGGFGTFACHARSGTHATTSQCAHFTTRLSASSTGAEQPGQRSAMTSS